MLSVLPPDVGPVAGASDGRLAPLMPYFTEGQRFLKLLQKGDLRSRVEIDGVGWTVGSFYLLLAPSEVYLSNGAMGVPVSSPKIDKALQEGRFSGRDGIAYTRDYVGLRQYVSTRSGNTDANAVIADIIGQRNVDLGRIGVVSPKAVEQSIGELDPAHRPDMIRLTNVSFTVHGGVAAVHTTDAPLDKEQVGIPVVQLIAMLISIGVLGPKGQLLTDNWHLWLTAIPKNKHRPLRLASRRSVGVNALAFLQSGNKVAFVTLSDV